MQTDVNLLTRSNFELTNWDFYFKYIHDQSQNQRSGSKFTAFFLEMQYDLRTLARVNFKLPSWNFFQKSSHEQSWSL